MQYLVRLILCNDSALLDFRKDLVHLSAAETVILDSLIADIESLEGELTQVRETAKLQADRFAEDGKIQPFSIQELKEQKTAVRSIENVPQYNQIQHLTGRTSMERFTINASRGLEDAIALAHQVKDSYSKLLEYMCEKENMASNDFFGTMRRFADEFDKARDQVDKEEKLKVRKSVDSILMACMAVLMPQKLVVLVFRSAIKLEVPRSDRQQARCRAMGGRSRRCEFPHKRA